MSQPGLRLGRGVSESESVRCQQCSGLGHLDCDGRGVSDRQMSASKVVSIRIPSVTRVTMPWKETCARFGTEQVLLPDKLADCLPG